MRGKINRYAGIKRLLYGFIISAAAFMFFSENAAAITVNDTIFAGNPYISLSPDGNAFTVGYGDKSMAYHGNEYMGHTRVMFGDLSGGPLSKGQHYFSIQVVGRAPVGYWKVEHPNACCIHTADYYDLNTFGLNRMGATYTNCGRFYNAGWNAYCAYCGERLNLGFIYMTESMAASLPYLPSNMGYSYFFYLCPYDNSLEVTGYIGHTCRRKSNNRYRVIYNANGSGTVGSTPAQYFYYNNATVYNDAAVSAPSNLTGCGFTRDGYHFIGWSTRPDGPVVFSDKDSWLNVQNRLSAGDFADNTSFNLYAVWKPGVITSRPQVTDGENVYIRDPSLIFVRADGVTPFTVKESAGLSGKTDSSYMVNDIWLYENDYGAEYHMISAVNSADGPLSEGSFSHSCSENVLLEEIRVPGVVRSDSGRLCTAEWIFIAREDQNGDEITLIPRARAIDSQSPTGERLSSSGKDLANAVKIIFDGEKPLISGLEDYRDIGKYILDESETGGFPSITVKAEDLLSGVDPDDFYVRIDNLDNGSSRIWTPDENGEITVSFGPEEAEKYFYFGDFEITVHVADRVGNVAEEMVSGWGFDLKTEVKRLLEPKDGKEVFARGESGDLIIKTYGYAEQVEVIFPDELSGYSTVFDYTGNEEYEKDEVIRFMVPLYDLPEDTDGFTVTVIARKDGETLESHPRINIVDVEGTVLDELRTSLR